LPGKFLVLADLDGAAGVRNPHEVFPNFSEFREFGVANMAADASTAAEGLLAGGADEVTVLDGHFLGENLLTANFEEPIALGRRTLWEELARGGVAGVFLTGIHGKTGTPNSFSSHTIAPFVAARLDGDIIGDPLLTAYLCGTYGVPLAGASGDWVACEEVQWALHDLVTAPTKTGFDRCSVRHHNPAESRTQLREAASRAAKLQGARVLRPRRLFKFDLSFADEPDALRAAAAVDGEGQRVKRVVSLSGERFEDALAFAAKAVGALYPGWVDGLGRRALPEEPAGRTAGGMLDPSVIDRFYNASAPYWSD
jgi:D-amino peptidase